MDQRPRNPHVLAYRAVRDAEGTEEAKRVYAAMKSSPCYPKSACCLAAECPFYVDCLVAENPGDG